MDEPVLEETKKARAASARILTRRINELRTLYTNECPREEVREKKEVVKCQFDQLGYLHDDVISSLGNDAENPESLPMKENEECSSK